MTNKKREETIIVKVSFLGMSEEGTGSATIEIDLSGDILTQGNELTRALIRALTDATKDAQPHFKTYMREKYGDPLA